MERGRPGFIYTVEHHDHNGKLLSTQKAHNLFTDEGIRYVLGTAFKGASQFTSFYLGVYEANRLPVKNDTMITLMNDCQEITTYTVVSGARQLIPFPDVGDGDLNTLSAPNRLFFTVDTTVRGAFMTTNATRGANSGLLVSALRFETPEVVKAGRYLTIPVGEAFYTL